MRLKGRMMIFSRMIDENGWKLAEYETTYTYDNEFVLDAFQYLADHDLKDSIQMLRAADHEGNRTDLLPEAKKNGFRFRMCPSLDENYEVLSLAGISGNSGVPMQFMFYPGCDMMRIYCPDVQYIMENGDHVFDRYVNDLEIRACCMQAERKALQS